LAADKGAGTLQPLFLCFIAKGALPARPGLEAAQIKRQYVLPIDFTGWQPSTDSIQSSF